MKSTILKSCDSPWPQLDYMAWADTYYYLHQLSQIIGKLRLKNMPWQNHSWHSTLYINSNGLSTGSIPFKDGVFEIQLNFVTHKIIISASFHNDQILELRGNSIASIYQQLTDKLEALSINTKIHPYPNEMEEQIHFKDNEHTNYEPYYAEQFWQLAISTQNVFMKFRSDFLGKCSPIHFFWGAFDIAYTRFSGRKAPLHPGEAPNMPKDVMQEAYSEEVFSVGFWPGSSDFPKALFYAYIYPVKDGFKNKSWIGSPAKWSDVLGEYILLYDDLRNAEDPANALLNFLNNTYQLAVKAADWDTDKLHNTI